jgi:hypothetical protein
MKTASFYFQCPDCGSSHFGYSEDVGTCHGDTGCCFKWRRRDEWKYFVMVQEFESKEEYDRIAGL